MDCRVVAVTPPRKDKFEKTPQAKLRVFSCKWSSLQKKFNFAVDTRQARKIIRAVLLCTVRIILPQPNVVDAVKLDFFYLEKI